MLNEETSDERPEIQPAFQIEHSRLRADGRNMTTGMTHAAADWSRPERTSREEQLRVARAGARLLYREGARRVWLFGSMAKGRRLGVHSDFDYATEGLPPGRYLGCLGVLLQEMPLPVDLVELESASPFLRARVASEGLLLPDEN